MIYNDLSFEQWMEQVDEAVQAMVGCSVYDLPDYCFRDAYEEGRRPRSVARDVLKEAGY
jgi:hypothetical protein